MATIQNEKQGVKPQNEKERKFDSKPNMGSVKGMFSSTKTLDEEGEDRRGFIKKVYAITATMMLITTACVFFVLVRKDVHEWMKENLWLHYAALFAGIALMIGIICCKSCARKVPNNYIYLFLFTICWSYMVAGICGYYEPEIVALAATVTLFLFLGLTTFACCCKGMKLTCCWVLGATLSFAMWPMLIWFFIAPSKALYNVFNVLGVIVCSIYIMIDTKIIMSYLAVDEYVFGALMLYIDLIQLFLHILSLMGNN